MLAYEREMFIKEHLKEREWATISELAAFLGVSVMTVRRDARKLSAEGVVRRFRGGVSLPNMVPELTTTTARLKLQVQEKRKIARAAAQMITPGMTIAFDLSSTCIYIAQAIADINDLIVLTDGIHVVSVLGHRPNINLILTGGSVRPETLSMIGPVAERTIREHNVDKAFLSGLGLDPVKGLTDRHPLQDTVRKAMASIAREVVVVADYTKLGKASFFTICPPSAINTIITDDKADSAIVSAFESLGIRVVVATDEKLPEPAIAGRASRLHSVR